MPGKIPPHNIDAEEAIIGSILLDSSAIDKVADFLQISDFYHERNRMIYAGCVSLYQRDEAINQITLAQELSKQGKLESCGGAAYLSYLISNCPTPLDIEYYANIVHRLSVMRQLIAASDQIAEIGYSADTSIIDAIDKARALVDGIMPAKSRHLELSNLRIIKSKPPHYILNINGTDVTLTVGQLQSWSNFRTKVLTELDFLPTKPKNWEGLINKLLEEANKMQAPVDTSLEVEVKLSIKRWFEQRGEGTEYSDIQSGCYAVMPYRGKETNWEQKDYWVFQVTPLLRWLKRDLGKTINRDTLWAMAVGWDAIQWQWRVGKNPSMPVKLWGLPPNFAQKEEFAIEEEQKELPIEEASEEHKELPAEEADAEELPDI